MAVLGFLASKLLSKNLLKAIAALLAVTMHTSTNSNLTNANCQVSEKDKPQPIWALSVFETSLFVIARKKPIIANGSAKMVWENLTRLRYFFMADI
jgi:hypothetical protein